MAIRTESQDEDVTDPDTSWVTGGSDGWVVKLTSNHQIQWGTVIGGSNWDDILSIIQTDDGGYAVAGYTASNDGCVTGHLGGDSVSEEDAWITKLNDSGKVEWSKCYGNLGECWAESIVQTPDHGYCFAGYTSIDGGEVTGYHGGLEDAWVVKIDSIGNFEWGKCLGGDSTDWASSIVLTNDSGFFITGGTQSNDGDVSGNHGDLDAWAVKLTASGDIQWQRCLGGSFTDKGWYGRQTSDGGYVVACMSMSDDGDVTGQHGAGDAWIVKLDPAGNIVWQKCVGGSKLDAAFNIIQLTNGDFAFIGQTGSNDGDILLDHGNEDMLVAVLSNSSSVANPAPSGSNGIVLYPQPARDALTIGYTNPAIPCKVKIEVRNVLGITVTQMDQEVTASSDHEAQIDLHGWMPGCYFVSISGAGISQAAPFLVMEK